MDPPPAGVDLREGTRALERADWNAARLVFERVLEAGAEGITAGGTAEEAPAVAAEGLGLALWFTGRIDEGVRWHERAFARYAAAGRQDDAARVAVWVSDQYGYAGRSSASRGWLARAERAITRQDGSVLATAGNGTGPGWVAIGRAQHASSVQEQAVHARRAVEIGRRTGAEDLEVFALSLLGRTELLAGRQESGFRLLEEAMVAATSGRIRNVHAVGEAYCTLVTACAEAEDWERAVEWCEHVEAFARTHHAAPLFGVCRSVHAQVLVATGHWPEAELALEAALATHARAIPELSAPALATLAELRLAQGRLREAAGLLAGREEHPDCLRAQALLHLAQGRPGAAISLLRRGLQEVEDNIVQATHLLAALTDAHLAAGEVRDAAEATERLARLAEDSGLRIGCARAELARARVGLASGVPSRAVDPARRALRAFGIMAMPLEAGLARLELARSLAPEDPGVARDELHAAMDAFRELGATRALDTAADLLRGLGEHAAPRRRITGALTAREAEVLDLLALGMSNARIATALHISTKTAGHHVSRILMKLGVQNRAAAAAYAVGRHGEPGPPEPRPASTGSRAARREG